MSDEKKTDPYNGELENDADLDAGGDSTENADKGPDDEDAVDDAAHLLPKGSGLDPDVPGLPA